MAKTDYGLVIGPLANDQIIRTMNHQEAMENAYDDIDCLVETGEHAALHPEYWGRN